MVDLKVMAYFKLSLSTHNWDSALDKPLLKQREAVYEAARCQNPERWSGKTRNWTPVSMVALNPENERRAA